MEKLNVKAEILKLRETNPSPEKANEWLRENAPRILSQIITDISKNISPYLNSLCLPFLLVAMGTFLEAAKGIDANCSNAADELRRTVRYSAVVLSAEMDPEE